MATFTKISREDAPQPSAQPEGLSVIRGDVPRPAPRPALIREVRESAPRPVAPAVEKPEMGSRSPGGGRTTLAFNQRPFFIAARYKYVLILPFVIIMSVALAMSVMSRSTQYSSVSRVLVQSARFEQTDPNSSCNPYVSLAQCIAGSMNMLLATDQFATDVATEAGLPVGTEAERAESIQVVRSQTGVYAAGEGLVVIQHTASDPEEAQRLTAALVTTYDRRYIEIVRRDGERATLFYEAQLVDDNRAVFEANAEFARWRESAPVFTAATDPEYSRLLSDVQAANRSVQDTEDRLDEIAQFVSSVEQNREAAFNVVDPATPGIPVTTGLKQLMVFPIAGFLLALSISAALFTFLLKTDFIVRIPEDLDVVPGLTVLGTIPDLARERQPGWPRDFFRLAITTFGTPGRPIAEKAAGEGRR